MNYIMIGNRLPINQSRLQVHPRTSCMKSFGGRTIDLFPVSDHSLAQTIVAVCPELHFVQRLSSSILPASRHDGEKPRSLPFLSAHLQDEYAQYMARASWLIDNNQNAPQHRIPEEAHMSRSRKQGEGLEGGAA